MVDGPDGFCQSHEAKTRLKLNVSGIKLNKTERNRHGFQGWATGPIVIVVS